MVGNDVREARPDRQRNWLLDMNPETATRADAALPVGKRLRGPVPGGPKFTVLSADATKAVIQVELSTSTAESTGPGEAMCGDHTP